MRIEWYTDSPIMYSLTALNRALFDDNVKHSGYMVCLLFDTSNGHEQMERIIRGEFRHGMIREVRWFDLVRAFESLDYINKEHVGRWFNLYQADDDGPVSVRMVRAFVVWHEYFREGKLIQRHLQCECRWLYQESRSSPVRDDLTDFINRQV